MRPTVSLGAERRQPAAPGQVDHWADSWIIELTGGHDRPRVSRKSWTWVAYPRAGQLGTDLNRDSIRKPHGPVAALENRWKVM